MPKKLLGKIFEVKIDRPLGTCHPKFKDCVYPINYGFIPNTIAGDGMEIDVYVLRVKKPVNKIEAKIVGVILRENDVEFKLVAVPTDNCQNITQEEIKNSTNFIEQYFKSTIIM